ncbi:MAG: shikimate dehydrogenase [Desulfovibrionales bacterium]
MVLLPEHLFGIAGKPLGHSLSPLLHNWAFQEVGLPCVYMRWEIEKEDVPKFLDSVRILPIQGVSVTIPYKTAVMEYVDELTPQAVQVGAVNTLFWKENLLCGDNTDVAGFLEPLKDCPKPESALVLGAGGAALAVVAGLMMMGVKRIMVSARRKGSAEELINNTCPGARVIPWGDRGDVSADLVINATPLGMQGDLQGSSPWPLDRDFPEETGIVYDLVYNPLDTIFLRQARKSGCMSLSGLDMFLGQGAAQFALWTGEIMPLEGARTVLTDRLSSTGRTP